MAMESDISTYTGLEKLDPAGPSEEGVARRKRYSVLSDAQLTNRRDQLVQFLEGAWGLIGWDLRKARKAEEVQKALAQTNFENTGYRELLMPFVRNAQLDYDATRMRALRRKILGLGEKGYEASQATQIANDQLEKAKIALSNCSKANLRTLKREHKKREQQARRTTEAYVQLNKQREALSSELQSLESAFAQNELLRMVKSTRYSYTPLNLANGMAGLPYMGWRQSASRCLKTPCTVANGFWYVVFRLVQRVTANTDTKSETNLASLMKKSLAQMTSKRTRYIRDSLAENWFFLKSAIEDICRSRHHPKSIAFRITAAFQERMRSPSAEERVIADIEKLNFSRTDT